MTVADAVKGDQRKALTALRDELAKACDEANPRELPALAKQLVDVLARLDAMPGQEKSTLDDLSKRRSRRRSAVSERPAGGGVVGGEGGS